MKITVYTKPSGCPACTSTKQWLGEHRLSYHVVDLTTLDTGTLDHFRRQGFLSAPVVILELNGRVMAKWFGYREDLLEKHLAVPLGNIATATADDSLFDWGD